jgi:hypothetical protein
MSLAGYQECGLASTGAAILLDDAEFDEDRFEQHLEADPQLVWAACWYWIHKLQACFYAGDYESAKAAAAKAEPLLERRPYRPIPFAIETEEIKHFDLSANTTRTRNRRGSRQSGSDGVNLNRSPLHVLAEPARF